jgi:endoglucanase
MKLAVSNPRFVVLLAAGLASLALPAGAAALQIRLNTIGYLPDAEKKASIAAPCSEFAVVRVKDGAKIMTGRATGPILNEDTREQLYTADFSAFKEPGEYQLDVSGVGRSAAFNIATDVYRRPFYIVTRGMYLWRCGTAVSAKHNGQVFAHAACHTNDAWLDFVGGGHAQKGGRKGWHDAGDYNKYVVNAGVTIGAMFRAWEDFGPQIRKVSLDLPESGGELPDFLAELKWELDWLFTMQAPDGSVYHKLSTKDFGGFILPELETTERYFTPWSSAATADFVAILAQGSRNFRAFDPTYAGRCLAAAKRSYAFLRANPTNHDADLRGFRTGEYGTRDSDDRLWAAAELWETTGEADVLRDLEARIKAGSATVDGDFDWGNVKNLGLFTYLLSKRSGRDEALVKSVRESLLATADGIVKTRGAHGYARPLGASYYWGCNGAVARQSLVLMVANRVSPRPEYRATALDALNHLFGRNYHGRSYVTGLGYRPPLHPHDRRSGGDKVDDPWPGYLVGGAHPKPANWQDSQDDYRTNEIAINWNGALIYALAAFLGDTR